MYICIYRVRLFSSFFFLICYCCEDIYALTFIYREGGIECATNLLFKVYVFVQTNFTLSIQYLSYAFKIHTILNSLPSLKLLP